MKNLFSFIALSLIAIVISPIANVSALTVNDSSEGTVVSTDTVISTGSTAIYVDNSYNENFNASYITISPPDSSAFARLYVNESKIAYVEYGGSATLRWESNKMSSCSVTPLGQVGTNGDYVLQNITSNAQIGLTCLTLAGHSYGSIGWNRDKNVDIKVLPPTFDYLREYLSQMQSENNKKTNFTQTSVMIDQAQKAHDSNKIKQAQSFLQKSIDNLKLHATRGGYPADSINQYEHAAHYLSKVLPVEVKVATDGCSVTATGPAGLIVDYGAHELGLHGYIIASIGIGPQYPIIHGYLTQTTIPAEGSVTKSIPSRNGWTAFAKVVDSDGHIYGIDTVEVMTDCPALPSAHSTGPLTSF